jgi:omega-hydroxypalmitate O-feruloyl transferase
MEVSHQGSGDGTEPRDLEEKPLSFAVRLVQKVVAMMKDGYMRSTIDYFEVNRLRPSLTATFFTWSRLSFQTADFGWGEVVYSAPATLPERQPKVYF